MIDRDNGVLRGAARGAPADYMALFGGSVRGNDNRYTVSDYGRRTGRIKGYLHGYLGGIPIVERDVLILDRGSGGGDGFGGARFVVTVRRRVVGGDGEASRVARDLEAVTAVGANLDLLRRIDGRPYAGGGNDAALRGVGGPGRGDDFAAYGGGVSRSGRGSTTAAGWGTGGKQYRCG